MLHQPITHSHEWYRKSGVLECEHWNGRGLGGNDPDSGSVDCEDCDAQGYHPCEVCGSTIHSSGYDCLACDIVRELPAHVLADDPTEELIASIRAAVAAARREVG